MIPYRRVSAVEYFWNVSKKNGHKNAGWFLPSLLQHFWLLTLHSFNVKDKLYVCNMFCRPLWRFCCSWTLSPKPCHFCGIHPSFTEASVFSLFDAGTVVETPRQIVHVRSYGSSPCSVYQLLRGLQKSESFLLSKLFLQLFLNRNGLFLGS